MFCKKCGGRLENYATHCAFCGAEVEKYNTEVQYVNVGDKRYAKGAVAGQHTSVGKWFFIPFINIIPVVGPFLYFILLMVWGLGHSKDNDPTFKNWARAQLLYGVIAIIAVVLFFALFISLFPDIQSFLEEYMNDVGNYGLV